MAKTKQPDPVVRWASRDNLTGAAVGLWRSEPRRQPHTPGLSYFWVPIDFDDVDCDPTRLIKFFTVSEFCGIYGEACLPALGQCVRLEIRRAG